MSIWQTLIDAIINGKPLVVIPNQTHDGSGVTLTVTSGELQPVQPAPAPVTPPQPSPGTNPTPVVVPPVTPPPAPATNGLQQVTHPIPIPAPLKNLPGPYQTNSWWQNIVLGKNRIAPDPYQIQVVDNGYLICYPTQNLSGDSQGMQHLTTTWLQNFSLEFKETIGSWRIAAYDELTVTLMWVSASGQNATACIAQGSPYMSMAYVQTTPLLTTQHAITAVNGSSTGGTVSGTTFRITLNNGQMWKLYASASLNLTWSQGGPQLIADQPFSGIVRLAVLTDPAEEAVLDQYVGTLPMGATVSTAFPGDGTGQYTFTWKTLGTGPLLMMAYPHHVDSFKFTPSVAPLKRMAVKGPMTAIAGDSWVLSEQLPKITWTASKPIAADKVDAIKAAVQKDANFINNSTSDSYYSAKGLAKMARLLLIAGEVGDNASAGILAKNLQSSLATWLGSSTPFVYDSTWGGVVFNPSLSNPGADFGFSQYNDHVFHEGYLVYACAVMGYVSPSFITQYKDAVTTIVHDYCNATGSSDTRFTELRNHDWYAGHSWAAGLFDFADSRNLESTSEAINGYYGAMLWGMVSGDTRLQNIASLLLATEIRTAVKYWHHVKLQWPQWASGGAGMMWGTKCDDATWFSGELFCRRGIQILPLDPISELYLDAAWANDMINTGEMQRMLSQATPEWKGLILGALAVVDPATAWSQSIALPSFDDGNSAANQLYWIATR